MPAPGHEPFLRAICEAPDDDAPRLVFADWLDETGDPDRAEFIRLQIRLAREQDPSPAIERRCKELFRTRGRAWSCALPGTYPLWVEFAVTYVPRPVGTRIVFDPRPDGPETWLDREPALTDWERGFPATAYAQGRRDLFFAHVKEIAEFVPVHRLRLVNLDNPDRFIQALAEQPFLSKIRDLLLPMRLADETIIALANSPFATGLRFVSLVANGLTDTAGWAVARSPHLSGIEMLHLVHNQFSEPVTAALRARYGFRVHC
jgi:uncharacterized protein (TIGR02996 family)